MSDPDRMRQREHWQAIAEQLGLSPEPELSSSAGTTPPLPEKSVEPAFESAERVEREAEEEAASTPEESERDRESSPAVQEAVSEPEESEDVSPIAHEEQEREPAYEDSSERPAKTRRGRRGQGTRDRSSKEGAPRSHEGSSSDAESMGRKAARPSRRGGGQGRGRKERVAAESDKPPVQRGEKEHTQPADNEDDDADDLSSLKDWNVPSWNELIASLYRPER